MFFASPSTKIAQTIHSTFYYLPFHLYNMDQVSDQGAIMTLLLSIVCILGSVKMEFYGSFNIEKDMSSQFVNSFTLFMGRQA